MTAKSPRGWARAWPPEDRIQQWVQGLRRAAADFVWSAFPGFAETALAMESAGLVSGGIPQLFARDLRQISPALNDDLLDLYGRSEQVLANQFAFHNHSEILREAFDWEFHESPGWRAELHAFDYALDLAMTYRISQEERYATHLRYLIAHWIAQNPPALGTGWELAPLARRICNWILAADLAREIWQADEEFLEVMSRSLAMQGVFLLRQVTADDTPEMNAQGGRALVLASKFFRGAKAIELAEAGRSSLVAAASVVLAGDASSHAQRPEAMLRITEAWVEYLVLNSHTESPQREFDLQIASRMLSVLEGALSPLATLPLFGESARAAADELSALFALATVILDDPRWKTPAGKFGILPYLLLGERGRRAFDELPQQPSKSDTRSTPELAIHRMSLGPRSAMVINARRYGMAGDHQDFLTYELNLDAHTVITDSGAYSPPGESWDGYFPSARAHNVLLVDHQPPRPSRGTHAQSPEQVRFDHAAGICFGDNGYEHLNLGHRRAFYALHEDGWAVLDLLEGDGKHSILNLIHFFPAFNIEVQQDRAIVRSRAAAVTIIPLGAPVAAEVKMKSSRGADAAYPGFFSPDVGVKYPTAVLALELQDVPLPWIGGYLILRSAAGDFRQSKIDVRRGFVEFELEGKAYGLNAH